MYRFLKKFVLVTLLLSVTATLGACRTTRDDRIKIGTIGGAAIGAGIGAVAGGSVLPGLAAGAATGAALGAISE